MGRTYTLTRTGEILAKGRQPKAPGAKGGKFHRTKSGNVRYGAQPSGAGQGVMIDKDDLLNALRALGCDRSEQGFHVDGSITSFMGAGDEFVVGPDAVFYVQGKPHPLGHALASRGSGLGVNVIGEESGHYGRRDERAGYKRNEERNVDARAYGTFEGREDAPPRRPPLGRGPEFRKGGTPMDGQARRIADSERFEERLDDQARARFAKSGLILRGGRALRALLAKATQFGLFGENKEIQEPGKRGGKFYRTKKSNKVRYGTQPTGGGVRGVGRGFPEDHGKERPPTIPARGDYQAMADQARGRGGISGTNRRVAVGPAERREQARNDAIAHAAPKDAGDRSMRAAGRTKWNADDLRAATAAYDKVNPDQAQMHKEFEASRDAKGKLERKIKALNRKLKQARDRIRFASDLAMNDGGSSERREQAAFDKLYDEKKALEKQLAGGGAASAAGSGASDAATRNAMGDMPPPIKFGSGPGSPAGGGDGDDDDPKELPVPKGTPAAKGSKHTALLPAYGRDYKDGEAAAKDFLSNQKDFIIANVMDRYDGKPALMGDLVDAGYGKFEIRYNQKRDVVFVDLVRRKILL